MAFDDFELRRIENSIGRLCQQRTSPEFADELRFVYEVDGHSVSIYEIRPVWNDPSKTTKMGVARFKYTRTKKEWRLYWMRRDLEWHLYDPDVAISKSLEPLVEVVETDRSGAFFG